MKKWLVTLLALCLVATMLPITTMADEPCTHPNGIPQDMITDWSSITYQEIEGDNRNHYAVGKGTRRIQCNDCQTTTDPVDVDDAKMLQLHTYLNNVCTQCGHENTCTHEHVTENAVGYFMKTTKIEFNETTHTITGNYHSSDVCDDCGLAVDGRDISNYEKTENHQLNPGNVCAICGYGCDHNWENGRCTKCYLICQHIWEDGVCTICTMQCPHLMWRDGVCDQCGLECDHDWSNGQCTNCHMFCQHNWVDGVCTICEMECPHYMWTAGVCNQCGLECEHDWEFGMCKICHLSCQHNWEDGVCTICEMACSHVEWTDGVCDQCGLECDHDWVDGQCIICDLVCQHNWQDGQCTICEKVCGHGRFWEDGVCSNCGYECQHERKSTKQYDELVDGPGTDNGDGTCTTKLKVYDVEECEICGKVFSQTDPVEITRTDYHDMGPDTAYVHPCKYCGLECKSGHANTEDAGSKIFGDSFKIIEGDAEKHLTTGSLMRYTRCTECKTLFIHPEELIDSPQPHVDDGNGNCKECGYKGIKKPGQKLEEEKKIFADAKTAKKAAAGTLVQAGDSDACKQLIAAAQAAIEALAYDESKSEAENEEAIKAILDKLASDLTAQRAADVASVAPQPGQKYSDATGDYTIKADGTAIFNKAAATAGATVTIDKITINGQQVDVTEIDANAFAKNKKLKKVTIGPKIKTIGKKAFFQCVALKTVSGGQGLEQILDSAFEGCKVLAKFTFNDKLTKLGKKAFFSCAKLKTLTFKGAKAPTMGSNAFGKIAANAKAKAPKKDVKNYSKNLKKAKFPKTGKLNSKAPY